MSLCGLRMWTISICVVTLLLCIKPQKVLGDMQKHVNLTPVRFDFHEQEDSNAYEMINMKGYMLKHQKRGTDNEYHNSSQEKKKSGGDFKETSLR